MDVLIGWFRRLRLRAIGHTGKRRAGTKARPIAFRFERHAPENQQRWCRRFPLLQWRRTFVRSGLYACHIASPPSTTPTEKISMATTKKPPAKKALAKKSAPRKTTAPAKKAPRTRADATTLLAKDHKDVKALFKRYDKLTKAEADGSERQELAEQICQMLTVHATIEEEIFYPAVREADVDEDLLDEAEVEHASAKDLIGQIQSMSPDDDLYDAKVTVLGEYINHHVEEEEGEMFPKARRAKVDLVGLAEQLTERKQQLMSESGQMADSETAVTT